MKSKRVVCLVFAIIFVLAFAACSQNTQQSENVMEYPPEPPPEHKVFPRDNLETAVTMETDAVWEGYTDLPFDEYLSKGISAVNADYREVKELEVVAYEGWVAQEFLDDITVGEGSRPVTYVVDSLMVSDGLETAVGYKFYMELTADNKVVAVGFEEYEEGRDLCEVYYATETTQLLENLKLYM